MFSNIIRTTHLIKLAAIRRAWILTANNKFLTDFPKCRPAHAFSANCHQGIPDGGTHNAVGPRHGQVEKSGHDEPNAGPCQGAEGSGHCERF